MRKSRLWLLAIFTCTVLFGACSAGPRKDVASGAARGRDAATSGESTVRDSLPSPNPAYVAPSLVRVDQDDILEADRNFVGNTKHLRIPTDHSLEAIPKSFALAPVDGAGSPLPKDSSGVTPLVVLATYTDDVMMKVDEATHAPIAQLYVDRLVWAVIYEDIPPDRLPPVGPATQDGTATPLSPVPMTWINIVDAHSGRALVGFSSPRTP